MEPVWTHIVLEGQYAWFPGCKIDSVDDDAELATCLSTGNGCKNSSIPLYFLPVRHKKLYLFLVLTKLSFSFTIVVNFDEIAVSKWGSLLGEG